MALYDVEPRNHRALGNLFGQHIVLTGLAEGQWGSVIGRLARLRTDADYNAETIFSEADADGACQQADAFANRIHALLGGIVAS